MADKIVVIYRRDDATRSATMLFNRLRQAFPGRVLMNGGDSIEPVAEKRCALVVVIGPNWVSRELENPSDVARQEIASALAHKVLVVPALVQGGRVPEASQLPSDISSFSELETMTMRDGDWEYDCDQLIKALESTFRGTLFRKLGLAGLAVAGTAAIVLIAFGVMTQVHNRRRANHSMQEAVEQLASMSMPQARPASLRRVPSGVSDSHWQGSVNLQDRAFAKFDEIAQFHFHEQTVDIDTKEGNTGYGTRRVDCPVYSNDASIMISCPMVRQSLWPVTYRLKMEGEKITGMMVVYCGRPRADNLCPPSGMLFYDVALKRTQ